MSVFDKIKSLGKKKPEAGPANLNIAAVDETAVENEINREVDGERGIPSVSSKKGTSKTFKTFGTVFIVLTGLFLIWAVNSPSPADADKQENGTKADETKPVSENALTPIDFSFKPKKPETTPLADTPSATPIALADGGKKVPKTEAGNELDGGTQADPNAPKFDENGKPILSPEEKIKLRKSGGKTLVYNVADSGTNYGSGSSSGSASGSRRMNGMDAPLEDAPPPSRGDYAPKLKATSANDAPASMVFDRNFLLAKGTTFDCTMETRLVSTVPGPVRCKVARDVYSDNGQVLLIEAGTVINGLQQGGLKQGENRIFVLWEDLKTTKGVFVQLASPAADPLGGSGLEGYVDTHFWQRFGGAVMLSLVEDALGGNNNGNGGYSNNGGSDVATEALRNTINIPPTLYKNHGQSVIVYLARNLDFRPVYSLQRVKTASVPSDNYR